MVIWGFIKRDKSTTGFVNISQLSPKKITYPWYVKDLVSCVIVNIADSPRVEQ